MARDGEEKRSPIKQPPLRQAGQSLDEKINDTLTEEAVLWIMAGAFAVALAIAEWIREWFELPPAPWSLTIFAVIVAGIVAWRLVLITQELRQLALGRKGEIVVGQCLEELRAQGYAVLHDITGNDFNVDHILVGPAGVFAVETKTRTKPTDHDAQVVYDGQTITVDGFTPERDPVKQVKAEADFVRDLIESATGKRLDVRPVVLFPGWYTKFDGPKDIWVLNPKLLVGYLRNERRSLSDEDVRLISFALSTYVRSKAAAESR